jgi:hypothetical protein
MPENISTVTDAGLRNGQCKLTVMPQRHLRLHSFELLGYSSLRLSAHFLPSPLLHSVEFLVDVHFAVLNGATGSR